ncbi:glutathione S-transferase family protein [Utexia brackfieldae]|uniref:glutathione S-transferase family protein n=1 Tax=Utexia brackfieldae TaxID=3074108 RepID=UPI00370D2F3B
MKIYTYPKSRSLRVLWTLEELGISYDTVKVDLLEQQPNVVSPHPRGKVPFMVDGDISIEETLAICLYLCEKYKATTLYSSEIEKRASIHAGLSFALTDLESPIWNLLKQLVFIPQAQRSLEIVNYFKTESSKVIRQLPYDPRNMWVTGDNFTLADIFMSHTLLWAQLCGLELNADINDYIHRATSRPAYLRAQTRNNQ